MNAFGKWIAAGCLLVGGPAFSEDASAADVPALMETDLSEAQREGEALMRRVRAQLPPMPLRLAGFVRTREGRDETDRNLEVVFRFGDPVPNTRYKLWDAFGDPLVSVEIRWPRGRPVYTRRDGDGEETSPPSPGDPVADTGLTWSDLSMDFLWWPDAELTGGDRVKARSTHVVEIPAPPERKEVGKVKLWVDEKALLIVRAELLDSEGNLLKRIEVDTIKKVRDDFWMVKDLIVRDRAGGRTIGIRFEEVEELEPAASNP